MGAILDQPLRIWRNKIMADLALRMEHLLVTVAMIRFISLYRKLTIYNRLVAVAAAKARWMPVLIQASQESPKSKLLVTSSTC
jgi:hypothetical protein